MKRHSKKKGFRKVMFGVAMCAAISLVAGAVVTLVFSREH